MYFLLFVINLLIALVTVGVFNFIKSKLYKKNKLNLSRKDRKKLNSLSGIEKKEFLNQLRIANGNYYNHKFTK